MSCVRQLVAGGTSHLNISNHNQIRNLTEGYLQGDTQLVSIRLRRATDLAASIKTMADAFSPTVCMHACVINLSLSLQDISLNVKIKDGNGLG